MNYEEIKNKASGIFHDILEYGKLRVAFEDDPTDSEKMKACQAMYESITQRVFDLAQGCNELVLLKSLTPSRA